MQLIYHPNRLKGKILNALNESPEPLTSRELMQKTSTESIKVLSNAINVLVQHGLIRAQGKRPSITENGYTLMAYAYTVTKR
jgi:DNA-binding HxlR family transcriptional regulator